MEDYNRVLEATEVSQNANGVAAEKMTVYNESLEAAQNRLTASVQQFAQDSNLDRTLALAYDGLSKVVEILNILLNKIPVLSPLIKALGVAIATAFAVNAIKNISKTTGVIGELIKAFTDVQSVTKATVGIIPALKAAFTGLTGVIAGTTSATAAFGTVMTALGGPVGVAITAIGALIALLPTAIKLYEDFKNAKENALKESTQELEDANQNLEETNSQIKDIQDKINEINNKGGTTLVDQAEKERLEEQLDTLTQIKQVQEDIAAAKKAETLKDTKDVIREKYSEDEYGFDYYGALTSAPQTGDYQKDTYDTQNASIEELIANIRYLDEAKKSLNATDEDYQEQLTQINQVERENRTALLQEKSGLLDYKEQLIELGDTSSDEYQLVNDRINDITLALDPSQFPKIDLGEMIETSGMENKIKMAVQSGSEAGKKVAEGYAEGLAEQLTTDESMEDTLKEWADSMEVSVEYLKNNTGVLTQEILSLFQQMYGGISEASESAAQGFTSQHTALDAYQEAVQNVHDSTTDLTAAYQDMIDKGYISESVVKKLIKAHPELTKELKLENGQYTINLQVLKDVNTATVQSAISGLKSQKEQTEGTIKAIETRILGYQKEAEILAQSSDDPSAKAKMIGIQHSIDRANWELEDLKSNAADVDKYIADLQNYADTWSPPSKKSGSSGKKSGKSDAEKQFETDIKNRMKYLKGIVSQYALEDTWEDQATIDKYTTDWNNMLSSVVDTPEARKIVADALGVDISKMSGEEAKTQLTKLLKEQYGDIQTEYKKLLKSKAKEDLNSAKAIINGYKEGVYGAWSSDEALNAAKADYQKFIDEITNNADYRAAMAEALNLGDISGKSIEDQVKAVIEALLKSTGALDDAQQDLYDDASKNIKALQDEIEDMIDTAIDLLEKAGDFLFDMLGKISDRYDAQIDNLDKISDKLDDQKDAFEDKIDQQKELLKLQKKEMDNADELAEKNKSIADIDAQLMELQYDDSAEAQAKRLKLLDERAEKEKDLADWQKDNDYNTKIDALDKEKSEYEKTIEAEKKAIEAQKQTLQDAQKQFETTLGNIKNGFDTFIKILSSDLVKNLISKALIGTGQDTVTNLLTGYNKIFGSGIDSDVTGIISKAYKSVGDIGGKLVSSFNLDGVGSTIGDMLNNITKNFGNFANSISQVIQPGIQSASGIFNGLGNTLKGAFNLDWNGIVNTMGGGLQTITTTFSSLFSPIAKGASAIGDAIGAGITGFFPGIFTALGTLVSTVGTAMGGVLDAIATAMASVPVVGWVIAAAAVAGAIALVASIASIVSKTKSSKVAQPTQSFTAKKHHTGADYVKKENPALDKMLGLNDDETVSILHVGEAVVPTWANNATSSASSNRFTGSPFGSAVDTAVKSARANSRTYSSSDNSTINISMPINIQGDADSTTVNSLRKEADNIVNRVLKTINSQTRIGGYKNIKAATV
nr:MAG TPA: chromosome segregation ATPase [Caudoviricetes sp.]